VFRPNHKQKAATVNFWRLAASVLLIQGVVLGTPAQAQQTEQKTLKYGELLEKLTKTKSRESNLTQGRGRQKSGWRAEKSDPPLEVDLLDQNPELIEKLREKKVELDVEATTDNSAALGLVANLFLLLLLLAGLMMICVALVAVRVKP
jgi:cell division protease FtsH